MIFSKKYEVIGMLGQGGMGKVYKVRHSTLGKEFALKVLLTEEMMENREMVDRFSREARVLARLKHPNIVEVTDFDRDESQNCWYFVMEYIAGVTLGQYLRAQYLRNQEPLPLPEILNLSRQIAEALDYAHSHTPAIIHRDVKPGNIMIEDRSARVVVMDFGIAKELGDPDLTNTGAVMGTYKYASPEQIRQEQLDGRADVYSLGMVIYEMYTNQQFFAGLDAPAVLGKVLYDANENEPTFENPPPPAFAELVTKAIRKNRARRYQNMPELIEALAACRREESATFILQPHDEDGQKRAHTLTEELVMKNILTRNFTAVENELQEAIPLLTQAAGEAETPVVKQRGPQDSSLGFPKSRSLLVLIGGLLLALGGYHGLNTGIVLKDSSDRPTAVGDYTQQDHYEFNSIERAEPISPQERGISTKGFPSDAVAEMETCLKDPTMAPAGPLLTHCQKLLPRATQLCTAPIPGPETSHLASKEDRPEPIPAGMVVACRFAATWEPENHQIRHQLARVLYHTDHGTEALEQFKIAADQGYLPSVVETARLMMELGNPRDNPIIYARRAAEGGSCKGMHLLGNLLLTRGGNEAKVQQESEQWLKRAASCRDASLKAPLRSK